MPSLLYFFLAAVFLLAGRAHGLTVVIDPGHGGIDRGATHDQVMEKHLALDTAFRLKRYLEKRGVRCRLTRTRDSFPSLSKRVLFANRYSNAIFVSIHYNSYKRRGAQGLETFYHSPQSRSLADYVHNHVLHKIRPVDRGVKRRGFYVIRRCRHPAILIEGGFLSNRSERDKCVQGAYRQKIAEGIGRGIILHNKKRR